MDHRAPFRDILEARCLEQRLDVFAIRVCSYVFEKGVDGEAELVGPSDLGSCKFRIEVS
jgi:hypothetical protein